jgi:hypothetical protein
MWEWFGKEDSQFPRGRGRVGIHPNMVQTPKYQDWLQLIVEESLKWREQGALLKSQQLEKCLLDGSLWQSQTVAARRRGGCWKCRWNSRPHLNTVFWLHKPIMVFSPKGIVGMSKETSCHGVALFPHVLPGTELTCELKEADKVIN